LKAGTTLIRTGRKCRVCGQEIVHIQDAAGWPVGPHDYFTCAAGTCKDVWRRATREVAEDFWGFSPSSESQVWQTIQSPIFEAGRKGAQR
jgi:hypothetical protein